MASKATRAVRDYWYAWVPAFLLLIEWLAREPSAFAEFHYAIAFRDQPWVIGWQVALLLVRSYLGYFILAALCELLFQQKERCFGGKPLGWLSPGLFILGYSLTVRLVFVQKPAISELFHFYLPKYAVVAALIFFLWCLSRWLLDSHEKSNRLKSRNLLVGVLVAIAVTLLSRGSGWQGEERAEKDPSSGEKPSFLLLGIDGTPMSVFSQGAGQSAVTRQLHEGYSERWIRFENAYTPTNSTYTTWFSILSGLAPYRSGVEFLYPNRRLGNVKPKDLLTSRLQAQGYETLYLSDCGATAHMSPELGYDRVYHQDTGVIGCGRALFSSEHPLLYLFGLLGGNQLFPELDSFCSAQYRPKRFFKRVSKEIGRLAKSDRPFLLAMHTCLPHHSLLTHLPAVGSSFRTQIESSSPFSQRMQNLKTTVRVAEHWVTQILDRASSIENTWKFVFSDHGARIDREPKTGRLRNFSHAVGWPLNRFQYHVPLYVLSPSQSRSESHKRLVSLLDLNPTISRLAGLSVPESSDARDLFIEDPRKRHMVLSSALPIRFSQDRKQLIQVFSENRVDEKGFHYFPSALEKRLWEQRPLAFLRLPYRLLVFPDGRTLLYDEIQDPHNERDLSASKPMIVREMLELFCNEIGTKCLDFSHFS